MKKIENYKATESEVEGERKKSGLLLMRVFCIGAKSVAEVVARHSHDLA